MKHLSTLLSMIALAVATLAWLDRPASDGAPVAASAPVPSPAPAPKPAPDPVPVPKAAPAVALEWACARVAPRENRPDQTVEVHDALKSCAERVAAGGQQVLLVEPGVRWNFAALPSRPAQVSVLDMSGYDAKRAADVAQIRWLLHTTEPEKKNAHELIVQADHHPALVIDNVDNSDKLSRASVILRRNGGLLWRIGTGHRDDDTDFVIARGPGLKSALNIDENGASMHFGPSAPTGVDYSFANADDGAMLVRYLNQDDSELRLQLQVKDKDRKLARAITFLKVDAAGRTVVSGLTLPVMRAGRNTALGAQHSGSVVNVTRATTAITLPVATPGLFFDFSVEAGATLTLNAAATSGATDRIELAGGATDTSFEVRTMRRIVAVEKGLWLLEGVHL